MQTVAEKTNKINEAIYMLQQLSESEQEAFAKEIKWRYILSQAKKIDATEKQGPTSMDEIVEEVREVRRERAEKRKMGLLQ